MAVPKRKTSPSRRGMRRSADALKAPTYIEDKDSGELRRPHHIDLKTGMYRGRQVLRKKGGAKAFFSGRKTPPLFLLWFPLPLIPFAVYNMIAFLTPGVSWTAAVTTVHMMSGTDWVLTWEDLFIAVAIFLLWIEIIKSPRLGMRSVMDHILAMGLFIAMLVEFLLVKQAGTSTFFLLMMIALVDVLGACYIGMRSGRRQIEIDTPDRPV